jgi:hypothetical protein
LKTDSTLIHNCFGKLGSQLIVGNIVTNY